jgi:hypothetical protein
MASMLYVFFALVALSVLVGVLDPQNRKSRGKKDKDAKQPMFMDKKTDSDSNDIYKNGILYDIDKKAQDTEKNNPGAGFETYVDSDIENRPDTDANKLYKEINHNSNKTGTNLNTDTSLNADNNSNKDNSFIIFDTNSSFNPDYSTTPDSESNIDAGISYDSDIGFDAGNTPDTDNGYTGESSSNE